MSDLKVEQKVSIKVKQSQRPAKKIHKHKKTAAKNNTLYFLFFLM